MLAALPLAIMVGLAILADRHLPKASELPMQWGWDGRINWTAPRRVALGFMPFLAALILVPVSLLPGEWLALPISAASLLLGQLLQLWLTRRHLLRRA